MMDFAQVVSNTETSFHGQAIREFCEEPTLVIDAGVVRPKWELWLLASSGEETLYIYATNEESIFAPKCWTIGRR